MHPEPGETARPSRDDNLGSGARRRRALDHLQRQSYSMSERELAARVAAGAEGEPEDLSDEEVRDIHVALKHFDLPKAADAGLVSWDQAAGTVRPSGDADLSETEMRQLFADGWDDEAAVSRDERRRVVLDVLEAASGEVALDDLAAEVAAHEAEGEAAPSDADAVAVALHHRHLPRLAEGGLVEYDAAAGTVAHAGETGTRRQDSPPAPPEPREPGNR